MKRLDDLVKVLQGVIILFATTCFLEWLSAWVMLIFNIKLAVTLFITAGISFAICALTIVAWGITLKKMRKKAVRTAYYVFDNIRKQANITGMFKVEMIAQYIVWITFYTSSVGVLDKKEIVSTIKNRINRTFQVIYEEHAYST